jgi:circadian clock protein KaiC
MEESPNQIMRNMRSVGIELEPHVNSGLLRFQATRPNYSGLEMHLLLMVKQVNEFNPAAVVVDPITDFLSVGSTAEVKGMLTRFIDYLKTRNTTALFTSLTMATDYLEQTEVGVSSLVDTWLLMRDAEAWGERNRTLYVLKSRGMAHSNQVREFLLTPRGMELLDQYLGPGGVLTGSARVAQEARDRTAERERGQEVERLRLTLERKRKVMEAQVAALQADFEADEEEVNKLISQQEQRGSYQTEDVKRMARSRRATMTQDGAESSHPEK